MKELHVISFNYPYPPSYGGIIDVYYKLKSLSEQGVAIYLHCFVDIIPEHIHEEVKSVVETVHFYKKKKNPFLFLSPFPYASVIRNSDVLIKNLEKSKAPVLFEGVQTTKIARYLNAKGFELFLRLHNNEYAYYKGLSNSEKNIFKKIVFRIESIKFRWYQNKTFKLFNAVFCLSHKEYKEVKNMSDNAEFIRLFHGNTAVKPLKGIGNYFLFHGDLSISDNRKALEEVIGIFTSLPESRLIVASDRAGEDIKNKIAKQKNIELVPIGNMDNLNELFKNAQANILLSYQNSGTKVKLFNSLYNSRFIIINHNITDDEALIGLCSLANDGDEIRNTITELKNKEYTLSDDRKKILEKEYNDLYKAQCMIKTIFRD